jgi:hypothetical protein
MGSQTMSLLRFRLAAARYSLGIATSAELIELADDLLTRGIYSYSLGHLAYLSTRSSAMYEVGPLFASALRELAIPILSKEDAVRLLVRDYFWGIAEGRYAPLDGALRFLEEFWQPHQFEPIARVIEDACGCRELVSSFHEYEYLMVLVDEGYIEGEDGERRRAALDRQVVESAAKWTREHYPVRIDPAWLTWNGGAVRNLARAIHEERAFDRLPILADALEEAGCDSEDVLDHCRETGMHVRGCWVVELLLSPT